MMLVVAAAFAALGGCKKGDIIGGSTSYVFIHRACDELHAYNYLLGSSSNPDNDVVVYWREPLPGTPLPASSYVLELLVGAESDVFGRPDMGNVLPPYASVESQILKKHFGRKTKSSDGDGKYYEFLRCVEYRTEVVEESRYMPTRTSPGGLPGLI